MGEPDSETTDQRAHFARSVEKIAADAFLPAAVTRRPIHREHLEHMLVNEGPNSSKGRSIRNAFDLAATFSGKVRFLIDGYGIVWVEAQ